ncbi:MAG TPA: hypothetical protein VJS64_11075 [Pyrinomonadaceae bacterium]|nr:hypothetical protein [Pyrinomonadaceae bacterium]
MRTWIANCRFPIGVRTNNNWQSAIVIHLQGMGDADSGHDNIV